MFLMLLKPILNTRYVKLVKKKLLLYHVSAFGVEIPGRTV